MKQKLLVGSIVHFVAQGDWRHCAAVVTNIWKESEMVNLYVFPDALYPMASNTPTSVIHDESAATSYSWHWIEKE